jgi:hypothetical protein
MLIEAYLTLGFITFLADLRYMKSVYIDMSTAFKYPSLVVILFYSILLPVYLLYWPIRLLAVI